MKTNAPALPFFAAKLGTKAGRMAPAGWAPTDTFAFVLGSDKPGEKARMSVGDFFEVGQIGDLFTNTYVVARVRCHFRPVALPGDLAWKFSILLDGTERVAYTLSREVDRSDLALPLSVVGTTRSRLAFRITLTGTAGSYDQIELPGVYVDKIELAQ